MQRPPPTSYCAWLEKYFQKGIKYGPGKNNWRAHTWKLDIQVNFRILVTRQGPICCGLWQVHPTDFVHPQALNRFRNSCWVLLQFGAMWYWDIQLFLLYRHHQICFVLKNKEGSEKYWVTFFFNLILITKETAQTSDLLKRHLGNQMKLNWLYNETHFRVKSNTLLNFH